MRPKSILWFERIYLFAFLLGLLNTYLAWDVSLGELQSRPETAQLGSGFLGVIVGGTAAISLLLWYYVSRRGSEVAKWILTIFFAFGALGIFVTLLRGAVPNSLGDMLALVTLALNAVAVWLMFRADARPWFLPDEDASDDLAETTT
jgi:hypothetical protein